MPPARSPDHDLPAILRTIGYLPSFVSASQALPEKAPTVQ
jgi:hypothetical protein